MLEEFEGWLRVNNESLRQKGIQVEFNPSNAELFKHVAPSQINKAAYAHFASDKCLGSITVWESGACDIDVLSIETGKPIWWKRYDLTTSEELRSVLANFAQRFTELLNENSNS